MKKIVLEKLKFIFKCLQSRPNSSLNYNLKRNVFRGPSLEAAMWGQESSRNWVGRECGIELPIAHETSILESGIDFSSSRYCTCALSLFLSVSFRNFHRGGIDSCQDSIPPEESMLRE